MENINDILLSHIHKVRDKLYVIIGTPQSDGNYFNDTIETDLDINSDNFDTMSNQLWGDVGDNLRRSFLKNTK
jgi:hypothetical protein